MTLADARRRDLADTLVDRRSAPIGPFKWVGNDYLRVSETSDPDRFDLAVVPADEADILATEGLRLEGSRSAGERVIARLHVAGSSTAVNYHVDGFVRPGPDGWRLSTPWGLRLLVVNSMGDQPSGVTLDLHEVGARRIHHIDGLATFTVGRWSVAVAHDGRDESAPASIGIRARSIAVAVDVDDASATRAARRAVADPLGVERRSRWAWSRYLRSCPVLTLDDIPHGLREELSIDPAALLERQLWHWWAARINVARTIDGSLAYVAPDRARWHGTWSSDGPITMSALALTSERETARDVFVRYLRASIDADGHLQWYTHATGARSKGVLGDTGVFSHGLPDLVRAAEFIDRHAPELNLLDEDGVGGRSVYDTLVWYLESSDDRDLNGDGVWETANLWESGWDNKVGPFFSSAPVDDWVAAIGSGDVERIAEFIAAHRRPVTALAEVVNHLMALDAMVALAERRQDSRRADWARGRRTTILEVITSRHWHEPSSTYRDWDATAGRLSDADCLDGFYFLSYEPDPHRRELLIAALDDPARFGLPVAPTLARDDPRFDPGGYWDGSHWPREMHYLALGLVRAGQPGRALQVLIEALASGRGSEILEHIDATDRSRLGFHDGGATIVTQAMSVGLCLGLLDLVHGDIWWPAFVRVGA